jgi:hypothetical protein
VCQEYVAESTRKVADFFQNSLGPGTKKRSREEEESTSSEIPEGENTSSTTISVDMYHSSRSIFYSLPTTKLVTAGSSVHQWVSQFLITYKSLIQILITLDNGWIRLDSAL